MTRLKEAYRSDCNIKPYQRYGRLIRLARGLTVVDLGAYTGINPKRLGQLETGYAFPYPSELEKLCDALEMDDASDYLMRVVYDPDSNSVRSYHELKLECYGLEM